MTRLSVNINKIATIRNARGGNIPDLIEAATRIQEFGADGITVHPRPDERHIRYSDVYDLKEAVKTEFNIEGYPSEKFIRLIEEIRPEQVTLVPDKPEVLTSNSGWDTKNNFDFLREIIERLSSLKLRVSLFIDPDIEMIEHAIKIGTDRVELYTEAYANGYYENRQNAIKEYFKAAVFANENGLDLNAGHDLNLINLQYFISEIPFIKEVSIGHALISDALYLGLENTVNMYKRALVVHETQL